MMAYVLSPRAKADIDAVWDYTAEHWGDDQAERYIRALMKAIDIVARDPGKARVSDDIRPGYRRYRAGSHVIFFRLVEGQIDIVRILHQSMDFDRRL